LMSLMTFLMISMVPITSEQARLAVRFRE
jgi:hypothetical protein